MDLDYKLKKPLATILDNLRNEYPKAKVFLNGSPNGLSTDLVSNSLMIALEPGHPFWMDVMQNMSKRHSRGITRYTKIMTTTGPELLKDEFRKKKWKHEVVRLDPKIFNPCTICSRGSKCKKLPGVLAYHMNDGAWGDAVTKIYTHMFCNWLFYVFSAVCLIVFIVVLVVLLKKLKRCRKGHGCKPCRTNNFHHEQ